MDRNKEERKEWREGEREREGVRYPSWDSDTWRSKTTSKGKKKIKPTLEFPATYWLLFGKNCSLTDGN